MNIVTILVAVLIFGLIVIIHEFGHFIVAKKCGIKVIEFSIGMGPRIFTFHGKATDYSLKVLPIGGSCSMLGEDSEEEIKEGSFNSKSVWARMATIFAGPFFNFILAFIMAVIIVAATGVDLPNIDRVMDNYPAQEAGIRSGDIITSIDKEKITVYRDITLYLYMHPGKTVDVTVKRNDPASPEKEATEYTFSVTPRYDENYDTYMLGIEKNSSGQKLKSIPGVLRYSLYEVQFNISMVIKSLSMLIAGQVKRQDIAGPVGMVSMIGQTVNEAVPYGIMIVLLNIANMILLFSANLGVMNLLPLPALDGGRLVFLVIEAILGRPVNRRMEGFVHFCGFVALMLLMVFVVFNDISKYF